jgi:hypothetical protein
MSSDINNSLLDEYRLLTDNDLLEIFYDYRATIKREKALEREVKLLKRERNEADDKCAVAIDDCIRWKREEQAATAIRVEAEARAERLREALEFIARGTTGSPDAIIARKALEDDKQ